LTVILAPALSVVVLLSLVIAWPIIRRLNRWARSTGEKLTSVSRGLYHCIEQQLTGMKEIKSMGAEQRQIDTFFHLTQEVNQAQYGFQQANATVAMIFSFGAACLLSVLLLIAVRGFAVPPAQLLVLVLVFAKLAPGMRTIQNNYQQLLHIFPAMQSVLKLQAECEAACEFPPQTLRDLAQRNGTAPKEVRLENVSYRYRPDRDVWAVRDVSLSLGANRTTALVGSSGAGKSTLADLLMGLITPEEGAVLLDGQPLRREDLPLWRRSIGYVPQETFLLNATVRENLHWAAPKASEAEIWQALEAASAQDFVAQLPQGLDTMLGYRGVRLSGGERQRIALARALLRRPSLLILDEATSHLDAENQARIHDALERMRGERTVVLIAHRLSTVRRADRIVVMGAGQIIESGAYEELARKEQGALAAMIRADGGAWRKAG
jgi:ATP-binding cassette subfamily C protein